MKQLISVVLSGALAVILFDTLASFISRKFQISYGLFSIGSFFIYICVGFFGAKYGDLMRAVIIAGIIGVIDSTIGWYISWIIGPGQTNIELTVVNIASIIIFVTITALLFGLVGALFSRWF